MYKFSGNFARGLLVAGLCMPVALLPMLEAQRASQAEAGPGPARQAQVRQVKVLGSKDTVEIEVDASDRIIPESQVLTGPDRLVVDFPNAVPGNGLRSQSVNRGEVKSLRIGLFQSRPPVTRVVVDLKTARSYQIFPNGRTVIIKVLGRPAVDAARSLDDFPAPATRPGLVQANFTTGAERIHEIRPGDGCRSMFPSATACLRSNPTSRRCRKCCSRCNSEPALRSPSPRVRSRNEWWPTLALVRRRKFSPTC